MSWTQHELLGRPADLFLPMGEPVGVVLFLHGYGEETLRGNLPFTAALESRRLGAVCPLGGRNWWLPNICPRFDTLQTSHEYLTSTLPVLQELFPTAAGRVGLLGVGMGGQGVLNLAFRDARKFPVVAALSPAIDFHAIHGRGTILDEVYASAESARQQTATLHLHPLNWPQHIYLASDPTDSLWFEGAQRLYEKLASTGIPCETDFTTTSPTPNWDYWNRLAEPAVQFIAERIFRIALPVVRRGES